MTTKLDKVLNTAKAHTTGGRDGRSVTDDGLLDVKLSPPKAMGGAGNATNPEGNTEKVPAQRARSVRSGDNDGCRIGATA